MSAWNRHIKEVAAHAFEFNETHLEKMGSSLLTRDEEDLKTAPLHPTSSHKEYAVWWEG